MTPTLKLAVFAVAATLAYLGLAILGWGGFAGFFSHPALIALASTLFVLTGVALFSGGNLSPGEREDRTNRWVIAAWGVIGVLAAYLPAYTDRKEFWTVDGDAVRWLGVVLFAAGGVLRLRPVFVLGHRFSGLVAIQPGHRLVTKRCLRRHPPPELSRVAGQLAGVGSRLPVRRRRAAYSASCPAARRPHTRRREAAAHAIRRRVRRLLPPHLAADPRALLSGGPVGQRLGAHAAQRQEPGRRGGDHCEPAGAQKDVRRRHSHRQQVAAQHGRGDAAQPADAERPAEAARSHARRVELAAGRIGAGLAADDCHPGKEDHHRQKQIRHRCERDRGDEHDTGGVMPCQRPLRAEAVDQQA